jgi:predicted oxidoreductase
MHFGGSWDAADPISADARLRAREAFQTVLECGWNFFDHADIYCRGKSETLFGELMKEMKVPRESVILQSKCGIRFPAEPDPDDPHRFDFSRAHIIASAEAALKRLGTDYLDIYLFHRPDLLAEPAEVMQACDELKTAGKVRFFGVSNFTPALLDLFADAGFLPVANQVELSLLKTSLLDASVVAVNRNPAPGHVADGTLEWHRRKGVVTQAWAPMAYGYLSGRAPDKDHERIGKAAEAVARIAAAHGVPAEAIVIAWLLRHPAGIQPVIGTRDPKRLRACNEALKVRLSREEWYALYLAGRGQPLP